MKQGNQRWEATALGAHFEFNCSDLADTFRPVRKVRIGLANF